MTEEQMKPNEAELYSLLQEANLLIYFPIFIEQGGDDVRQLCEATEEELQEIVSLVGMSSKPLHVRRLQKVLIEWRNNHYRPDCGQQAPTVQTDRGLSPHSNDTSENKDRSSFQKRRSDETGDRWPDGELAASSRGVKRPFSPGYGETGSGTPNSPKRISLNLNLPTDLPSPVIDWDKLDPVRQELIRDYSKIFGRDEKNRKTKLLNHHEELINEAATQLCLRDPTLLVRKDELFALARRSVKDSSSGTNIGNLVDEKYQPTYGSEEPQNQNSPTVLYPPSPTVPHPVSQGSASVQAPCPVVNYTPRPCSTNINYLQYQPVIDDVENEYDVIVCYKMHSRWPKGVKKGRKSHLRRKSRKMELVNGILFYRGTNDKDAREWVVDKTTRQKIIDSLHIDSNTGKHFGRDKTNTRVAAAYFWKGMGEDIGTFIRSCPVCKTNAVKYKSHTMASNALRTMAVSCANTALIKQSGANITPGTVITPLNSATERPPPPPLIGTPNESVATVIDSLKEESKSGDEESDEEGSSNQTDDEAAPEQMALPSQVYELHFVYDEQRGETQGSPHHNNEGEETRPHDVDAV